MQSTGKRSRKPLFRNLLSSLRHRRHPDSKNEPKTDSKPKSNGIVNEQGQIAASARTSQPPPVTQNGQTLDLDTQPPRERTISSIQSSRRSEERDGEADPDASIRPITPSSLKTGDEASSINTSRSYTGQTFKSTHSTASTKPTTLLSVGAGSDSSATNRIALGTNSTETSTHFARLPNIPRSDSITSHVASPSTASSIQFSALPTSSSTTAPPASTQGEHVPGFTYPNPKNNPNPASPALDNASTYTLASSSYVGYGREGSTYGTRVDEDASVRALAPSRQASESSINSRYSAALLNGGITSTPTSIRDISHLQHLARPASLRTVATTKSAEVATSLRGMPSPTDYRKSMSYSVSEEPKKEEEDEVSVAQSLETTSTNDASTPVAAESGLATPMSLPPPIEKPVAESVTGSTLQVDGTVYGDNESMKTAPTAPTTPYEETHEYLQEEGL